MSYTCQVSVVQDGIRRVLDSWTRHRHDSLWNAYDS